MNPFFESSFNPAKLALRSSETSSRTRFSPMQPRDGCNLQAVLATKRESFISEDISLEFNIFTGPTAVHQVTDRYSNSLHAGKFFMLFLLSVDFYQS